VLFQPGPWWAIYRLLHFKHKFPFCAATEQELEYIFQTRLGLHFIRRIVSPGPQAASVEEVILGRVAAVIDVTVGVVLHLQAIGVQPVVENLATENVPAHTPEVFPAF